MKTIFSEEHTRLVETLKSARLKRGYSQKLLATKLGKSQSYVSKLESGQTKLDVIELKRIAKVLKLDLQDILSR